MDDNKSNEPPSRTPAEEQRLRDNVERTAAEVNQAELQATLAKTHNLPAEEKQRIYWEKHQKAYEHECAMDSYTCPGEDHSPPRWFVSKGVPDNELPAKPTHNADFTMVDWYGAEYEFALGIQSKAVAVLWREWEKTGFGLHQKTIGKEAGAEDSFRMDLAFRGRPALGTMIQRCGDGRYRLCPPDPKPISKEPARKR